MCVNSVRGASGSRTAMNFWLKPHSVMVRSKPGTSLASTMNLFQLADTLHAVVSSMIRRRATGPPR